MMDFVLFFALVFALTFSSVSGGDPEVHLDALQLIRYNGYLAEAHNVTTSDGYILGLHRIPPANGSRPVVFLQHGLLCSSTNWLTNLKYESLAYLLADKGYDVWMGNVRGNDYSRRHVSLSPNDKKFWDFSFDQHSLLDLPAMIDYVLQVSGQQQLYYVGHSQGTMMGFAGFSSNEVLGSKVKRFYALAPVMSVKHIDGALKYLSDFYKELVWFLDIVGDGEFLPEKGLVQRLGELFCHYDVKEACGDVLFLVCGFNSKNLNESRLPVYLSHTPAGTSTQNIAHWSQMVKSGKFCMYDYRSENKQKYNTTNPPCYNISKMNVSTALFTGSNDWLADPDDVALLIPKLKQNGVLYSVTNMPTYEHLDFIWGINANRDVYEVIINNISAAET